VDRKPSTAADVRPPAQRPLASRSPIELTPAQTRAQQRSAPLTPQQFRGLRELAEHGVNPLRHL
jgi:hypothetical protein